jgi:ferrochelatase
MTYAGQPDYVHGSRPRLGVLLVNLGTPDAPTPRAVRRYLAEFLGDPRVVEAPRALWWLALHGVILRVRPRRSAHAYSQIWTAAGSPLLVHSSALADGLRRRLDTTFGERIAVELAMTYGQPSIAGGLERLRAAGVRWLLVLPLYPQYSSTTAGPVFERVSTTLSEWRWLPELRFVTQYCDEPAYVETIATSIERHWATHARNHLVFSFHSIPKRYLLAGDPYHCQCQATARRIATRLGLEPGAWSVVFQSRFGREEWLQPYADATLRRYAQEGPRALTVVCPGFATDCLETLEEIAMANRDAFLAAGGLEFDYVPCLNESDSHVGLLEQLVRRHAAGWIVDAPGDDEAPEAVRQRALALGARQ